MTTTVIHDTGVAHAPQPQPGWAEPLLWTYCQWRNGWRKCPRPGEPDAARPVKKLAHRGGYGQFRYGTATLAATRRQDDDGPEQWGHVLSFETGMFGADVDDSEEFARTRTGQLVGRQHAWTIRGMSAKYHVLFDARGIPAHMWPRQVPVAGADIKSRGFVPVPGSQHWTGDTYLAAPGARIWPWTPELLEAIAADQADAPRGHGGGGNGGGHDGQVAALTLRSAIRHMAAGLDGPELEAAVRADWIAFAVPLNPADPYTLDRDFPRHYSRAPEKARARLAGEAERTAASMAAWMCLMTGGAR